MMNEQDSPVAVLPIHYSNALAPNAHIHQLPLFRKPLQAPMSAILNGDKMKANVKPNARRVEVYIPTDDGEVRLQSERVPQKSAYVVGVVRNGRLHLHPVGDIQQLRPSLAHLDEQPDKGGSSKTAGVAADADDVAGDRGAVPQREDTSMADAKEPLVTTRKPGDPGNIFLQSGVTAIRREMLLALRLEEDERWEELAFCNADSPESGNAVEAMFSLNKNEWIDCATSITEFIGGARYS